MLGEEEAREHRAGTRMSALSCMVFGSAAVGAVALLTVFSSTPLPPPDVARALSSAGYGPGFVFGVPRHPACPGGPP